MLSLVSGLRQPVRILLAMILLAAPHMACALSMAFINPGKSTEPYWILATDAMQQVATSLNIELEVLTAERDYLAQIRLVESLAERPEAARPDYLIVAGEKATLLGQLEAAERAGIPVFLAFNAAQASREQVGEPRQRFSQWLGSLSPLAEEGGYLSARALITHALETLPEGTALNMLALSGDRSTHTSLQRNRGLQQALAEFPQVTLLQQVYADWSYDKGLLQSSHLLRRYPDVNLIWSASDLQAFGAIQALHESGRTPGQDVLVSAMNATQAGLEGLLRGELTALSGGHHIAGAWSMVLLHDYHHGLDFIEADGNTELAYSMFALIDQASARHLLERRRLGRLMDFCPYSRVCNPSRTQYDFSYARWLDIK